MSRFYTSVKQIRTKRTQWLSLRLNPERNETNMERIKGFGVGDTVRVKSDFWRNQTTAKVLDWNKPTDTEILVKFPDGSSEMVSVATLEKVEEQ
jgi:hypothetical protein